MIDATANYGEMGPEHFDRFGRRHHVRVSTAYRIREYMDADPSAVIKRLGLTLRGWFKRWPGMEIFVLDVWDRPLEIHSYSDGRIKLVLDGAPVYAEKTKIVTRHGEKHREIEQWFDPAVAEVEAEDKRKENLAAAHQRLADLKKMLASAPAGGSEREDRE